MAALKAKQQRKRRSAKADNAKAQAEQCIYQQMATLAKLVHKERTISPICVGVSAKPCSLGMKSRVHRLTGAELLRRCLAYPPTLAPHALCCTQVLRPDGSRVSDPVGLGAFWPLSHSEADATVNQFALKPLFRGNLPYQVCVTQLGQAEMNGVAGGVQYRLFLGTILELADKHGYVPFTVSLINRYGQERVVMEYYVTRVQWSILAKDIVRMGHKVCATVMHPSASH